MIIVFINENWHIDTFLINYHDDDKNQRFAPFELKFGVEVHYHTRIVIINENLSIDTILINYSWWWWQCLTIGFCEF